MLSPASTSFPLLYLNQRIHKAPKPWRLPLLIFFHPCHLLQKCLPSQLIISCFISWVHPFNNFIFIWFGGAQSAVNPQNLGPSHLFWKKISIPFLVVVAALSFLWQWFCYCHTIPSSIQCHALCLMKRSEQWRYWGYLCPEWLCPGQINPGHRHPSTFLVFLHPSYLQLGDLTITGQQAPYYISSASYQSPNFTFAFKKYTLTNKRLGHTNHECKYAILKHICPGYSCPGCSWSFH